MSPAMPKLPKPAPIDKGVTDLPVAPVIPEITKQPEVVVPAFNAVMHSVKSSSVQSIGFDPEGSIGVTFNTGKTFVYSECTPELFNQLAQSKSVGSAVHALLNSKPFTELK